MYSCRERLKENCIVFLRATPILYDKDVCNGSSIVPREKITIRSGQTSIGSVNTIFITDVGNRQGRVMDSVKGRRVTGVKNRTRENKYIYQETWDAQPRANGHAGG
jgi:hypothetical protein